MTFPHLFRPLQIGSRTVKNRVMLPPHAHVVSTLWGTDLEAERHIGYWAERTSAGWVDGVSAHVRNSLVPGFEPTGVGAQSDGHFRQPYFLDRVGRLAEVLHRDDTILTVQMILQGGMPHGASSVLSGPVVNQVPHTLTREEIDWFVAEYAHGAEQIALAGADGVELHLNHDDMLEYFLSPLTNRREDEYGGNLDGRLRFPLRILAELRRAMGPDRIVGVRLNLREEEPGGYDVEGAGGAVEIARALEASGYVDYLSCAIGSPWGDPSYIQSQHHRPAEWSDLAAPVTAAVSIPVGYTGRVTGPAVAEELLAAGHVDFVGMARAVIADGKLLVKAQEGRPEEIRPCVGGNECISRRIVDGTPFSCAVNPEAGREADHAQQPAKHPGTVLVVGGGPAGMEVAGIAAERGHRVTLWEQSETLGGQLRSAAQAPRHEDYLSFLEWQEHRLRRAGVTVEKSRTATVDAVLAFGADRVVVATGATPRRPEITGVELPHVHTSVAVLTGEVAADELGEHVLVVAQDDHLPPLSVADFLAERGHRVTLVQGTPGPAPLVSRYLLGSILARLDRGGVALHGSLQPTLIESGQVTLRHVYSGAERTLSPVDSVVLSCGAVPHSALHDQLREQGVRADLLGDAYAPRRMVFATKQARELALTL
ncbi:FAD-dependent oxidoreductase [Nocardioides daejeonensis]|uniref:oxidoreductase n=1 Tax=Nocardioides daejeonensis TaxID=1046556 RepID=UPI001950BB65|nr:FAD-dependent oxidoreductase [Nocardioides daejeonensis]